MFNKPMPAMAKPAAMAPTVKPVMPSPVKPAMTKTPGVPNVNASPKAFAATSKPKPVRPMVAKGPKDPYGYSRGPKGGGYIP